MIRDTAYIALATGWSLVGIVAGWVISRTMGGS